MGDPYTDRSSDDVQEREKIEILGWLRGWHWLMLLSVLLLGLILFPLWRFEHRWRQVQPGDSLEQVIKLLGDPGPSAYSVRGSAQGDYEAYVYRCYWRIYEVHISEQGSRVVNKLTIGR